MAKKSRNRAQRRRNNEETVDSFDFDLKKNIYVALGILAFLLVFYLLTIYITNKNTEKTDEEDKVETYISYKNIILGRSFDMGDGEYYVAYYDSTAEDIADNYNEVISTYQTDKGDLTIYVVDMHDALNASHSADVGNMSPTNASELQIHGPTLIKFDNHQVVEYIEGLDGIKEHLS